MTTPTFVHLKAGFADARANAGAAEQIVAEFPRQMTRIAERAGKRAGQREGRIFGVIGIVVAIVVSFLAGGLSVDNRAELALLRDAAQQRQEQTDATLARLADQNKVLEMRGQAPVPPPATDDPADALAALVLSRVVAQLPPAPTADQVAALIVASGDVSGLGPSSQQLSALAADYFGSGPGQAAIDAAVARAYAADPPADGRDGMSPPCLAEPNQCRGADGQPGADSNVPGPEGPEGPTGPAGTAPQCPDGTALQEVQYGVTGPSGLACVFVDD